MAILPSIPELTVEIWSNGSKLIGYDNDNDEVNPNTITKYVEAKSGENFELRWIIGKDFPHKSTGLTSRIYLDGDHATSVLLGPSHLQNGYKLTVEGVNCRSEDGSCSSKKFLFADISFSEESTEAVSAGLQRKMQSLGTISVRLWRENILQGTEIPLTAKDPALGVEPIPEKALKGRAISQTVKLDQPIPYRHGMWKTFKTGKALKIQGIVPRTPSPVPLEEREVDDLSPEEMRELLRRQRGTSLQIKVEQIKREKIKSENIKREKVNCEIELDGDEEGVVITSAQRCKRARTSYDVDKQVEIVDLSD
ncbi:hypothetical protein NA57DRAFT_74245 [Rhizodiscina lignyota]|uniref:DUF7918 domain-containing protein n=1 Tax=Rhizodiscina lignyota TaxID=1504668 RepID=A0A9P4MCG9_9PEZI|nr:hypothetical protein NA57DRAFT_74245 [Rhizodiscina lignyota]